MMTMIIRATVSCLIGVIVGLQVLAFDAAEAAQCSPYPHVELEHGSIRRSGFQKYSFRCDRGYFLASDATVRCRRGNWTSTRPPLCLKKQGLCDDPPVVPNAVVHGDDRGAGSTVLYICAEGFTLVGHSTLACTRGGHWDRRPPACMDPSEPLESVAERLKGSFVDELEAYSPDTPRGRLLDSSSLRPGLELFLLVDRSSSVDPVHLEDAKRFVRFLLGRFAVRNDRQNGTRASVVTFGTDVQIVFDLDDRNISSPARAAAALATIQPNGGGTNLEGALTQVLLSLHKLRPAAKRALFLITDGEPNIANPQITPQDLANELKNTHDFEIFAVGVGAGANLRLLTDLASEPPLSHVFVLKDYPNLNEVMKIISDSKPPPAPVSGSQCGYNATGEDRPWIAALYVGGGETFRMCGGVLVCEQWVLTAGSCLTEDHHPVDKRDVFVSFGERHLLKSDVGQTNFYVTDVRFHPLFDSRHALTNNLAMLRLNLPASRYRPACLPPTDRAIPLHLDLKINASVSGWGRGYSGLTLAHAGDLSLEMEWSPVSLAEERECPGRGTVVCAGQGSRTCYGQVGSPLMAEDPSTHLQHVIGILGDRTRCSSQGQNRYVELTRYIGWINHVTADCHLKHWGLEA